MRCAAVWVTLGLLWVGCEVGFVAERPGSTCDEAGTQCALPEGVLGVCERVRCTAGATAPCFICTPQH